MKRKVRSFLQNQDGKFLLVKHKQKNKWVLPGGHIENSESIYDALKREIYEELGIKIKIIGTKIPFLSKEIKEKPLPISIYEFKKSNGKKNLEYIFFSKIKKDSKIEIQKKEISEYSFFSKEEIKNLENTFEQIKILLDSI